jgi:hypothetical protein
LITETGCRSGNNCPTPEIKLKDFRWSFNLNDLSLAFIIFWINLYSLLHLIIHTYNLYLLMRRVETLVNTALFSLQLLKHCQGGPFAKLSSTVRFTPLYFQHY